MHGKSLAFFIYLYMVGGYIRLHFNRKVNKKICLALTFIIPLITVIIKVISKKILGTSLEQLEYFSNIFVFANTICLFLYFKDLKINGKIINKVIEKIAPLTFGIYLIHTSKYFDHFLWYDLVKVTDHANSNFLILYYFGTVFLVFGACAIIEYIRTKLFDKSKKESFIDKKVNNLNKKFWDVMEND